MLQDTVQNATPSRRGSWTLKESVPVLVSPSHSSSSILDVIGSDIRALLGVLIIRVSPSTTDMSDRSTMSVV